MRLLIVVFSLLIISCGRSDVGNNAGVDNTHLDTKLNNTDTNIGKEASENIITIGSSYSAVTSDSIVFKETEWVELIPKNDLDALLNPPDYIVQIADGSIEDQITNAIQSSMSTDMENNVYEKALISTDIIEAMNGKNIEIPGFIVPVDLSSAQTIESFFLVPYFGACLHLPPPPPNQIIFIQSEHGLALESLYEPVKVKGKLFTSMFEDEIATSAYTMELSDIKLYYDSE